MSMYSGKCDFCDEIAIFGLGRILNAKVYVGESETPLKLRSRRDCIPYYPHIVSRSFHSSEFGDVIRLSEKSWVDIEEERYGHLTAHDFYRQRLQEEIEKSIREGTNDG